MILANLYPESAQPLSQAKAAASFGVVGQAALYLRSSRADTDEKKNLRSLLETYKRTRNRSMLGSISMDQVLRCDESLQLSGTSRMIPYSSISKVTVKKPGLLEKGKVTLTHEFSSRSLSGREYSRTITHEIVVLEDNKQFQSLEQTLKQLLPNVTFS